MKKRLSIIMTMIVAAASTFSPIHGQSSSSLTPYSDGLDAKSTSSAKYVNISDNLSGYMLATSEGLTIIGNDQFKVTTSYPVKDYEIVSDVNKGGQNDILVYMDSPNGQDNVALISSEDSKVLFSKNYHHLNTEQGKGQFEENSKILQLLYKDEFIYILYDYHIVCLDLEGNQIFDYEEKDNIWKMIPVGDNGLAFTCQTGAVKMLDRQTGKVQWSTQLTGKLQVPTMDSSRNSAVQLNAWDIYLEDDFLYVTTEDGILNQLNIEDGNTVNSSDLALIGNDQLIRFLSANAGYDSQYRPTVFPSGITTSGFMGYTVEPLKDQQLLISAFLGNEKAQTAKSDNGMGMMGGQSTIMPVLAVYDQKSQQVKQTYTLDQYNLKSSNAVLSTYKDEEVLVVPSYSKKGELLINIYSLESGQMVTQESVKAPSIKEKDEKIKLIKTADCYLIQSEGNVTFFISNDFNSIEYVGNLSMASKIVDTDHGMLVSYSSSGLITKIKKLNHGNKDDVLFTFDLPEEFIGNSNGLEALHYDEQSHHLLMLVNKRNNQNALEASYILIINTDDGSLLVNDSVVLDKGTDENGKAYIHYVTGENIRYFKDMNNDGVNEILVDNYIIDGKSLTLKSFFSPTADESGLTIEVGDVNGDGVTDIALFGETQANLYYSKISGYDVSYVKSGIKLDYAKELQNHIQAAQMKDLDHDGINDIIINARNTSGYQVYRVLDGKTLQTKYDLMKDGVYNWGESFEFSGVDYNQDGVDDIIYNTPIGEVEIIDGSNGETLNSHHMYPKYGDHSWQAPMAQEEMIPMKIDSDSHKVALVEDLNGDGKKEVAYLSSDTDENYRENTSLKFLDGASFDEMKSIQIMNGIPDDYSLIGVVGTNKVMYSSEGLMQIYDYEKEMPVAGFATTVQYAKNITDTHLLISNSEGDLYMLDDAVDFSLSETPTTIKGGYMTLKWQSDQSGKMTISDGSETVMTTASNEATFRLLEGEHSLTLSYNDGYGKTTHQTIHVNVEKGHALSYFFNFGLVLVLGLIAGLLFYPKYRLNKKAGVKRG
ncbi:MAG: FG-GAP repeat domain-containing protein [Beduini sp.]|uniref:FG-GAP repeat domain-containing protein n=1 Tax=Beduini sp. TaxID=1922300 RepID=UPI0039A0492F